jgi:hypothetical protein
MSTGEDWLRDALNREPDFEYTHSDALADGVHQYVAEGVAVTDTVARMHPDPDEREQLALRLAQLYRSGVFADPPEADECGEANAWLAIYRVDGTEYWIQDAGMYLVVMRPEDY